MSEHIYDEVRAERERAHAKHGKTSMEAQPWHADLRQHILVEEIGEVAKEFNEARHRGDDHPDPIRLRKELIQVSAMAVAWADALTVPAQAMTDLGGTPPAPSTATGYTHRLFVNIGGSARCPVVTMWCADCLVTVGDFDQTNALEVLQQARTEHCSQPSRREVLARATPPGPDVEALVSFYEEVIDAKVRRLARADELLALAWRWNLVAKRYEDAEPGTPEALVGDIYDRLAATLLNTEPVRSAALLEIEEQA